MPNQIRLYSDDPVVFAACSGRCNRRGKGVSTAFLFYRAYSRGAFRRRPKCDNCKSPMEILYEVNEN